MSGSSSGLGGKTPSLSSKASASIPGNKDNKPQVLVLKAKAVRQPSTSPPPPPTTIQHHTRNHTIHIEQPLAPQTAPSNNTTHKYNHSDSTQYVPQTTPSWLQDLRSVWGQEINSMDADKQDWFLKQQEEVFNSAKKLGITFVEPIQTREAKSSVASAYSDYSISGCATTTQDEVELEEENWSKEDPLKDLLPLYDAPPPPEDSDLPETPGTELTDAPPVQVMKTSVRILDPFRRWITQGSAPEAELEQLQKYLQRLRAMISAKERRILELNRKMKNTRKKSKEEEEKFSKWAADQLANVARTYRENQILWLNTQLEVEVYYVRNWSKIAELIDDYLSKQDKDKYQIIAKIVYRSEVSKGEKLMIDPTEFELPEKYKILRNSLVQMEVVLTALRQDFREHRKAELSKASKMQDRAQKIRFLLRKGALDSLKDAFEGTYFHRMDKVSQNEFNRLMIDQRHVEGDALDKWSEFVQVNIATGIKPETISKGVLSFMKKICVENQLNPTDNLLKQEPVSPTENGDEPSMSISGSVSSAAGKEFLRHASETTALDNEMEAALENGNVVTIWPVLKVYVDRLIYPRFSAMLNHFTDVEDVKRDQEFSRKCRWLCKLTQNDFKIHPQLQYKSNGNHASTGSIKGSPVPPYGKAVKHLSRLEVECESVPINVLGHCVRFGKLIEEEAKEYITDKRFIYSADDLVPVVEWCISRARLSHLHEVISHTHRFLGNDASTGQGGYFLSSIEVALSALMNRTPADFNLSEAEVSTYAEDGSRASASIAKVDEKLAS